MRRAYQVPVFNRAARRVLKALFRAAFTLLARVERSGWENIPSSGPYILIYNHVSLVDPPALVAYWPHLPEVLGAAEVWNRPGENLIAHLYGGIPIRRGEVDRAAMEKMLAALRSGRPLMFSPEGTRSRRPGMQAARPGIVFLIEQTKVPVVPAGVVGTMQGVLKDALRLKRPRIHIRVGPPFRIEDLDVDVAGLPPKEQRQRKTEAMMRRLADLLPPEYRGVYGEPDGMEAPTAKERE